MYIYIYFHVYFKYIYICFFVFIFCIFFAFIFYSIFFLYLNKNNMYIYIYKYLHIYIAIFVFTFIYTLYMVHHAFIQFHIFSLEMATFVGLEFGLAKTGQKTLNKPPFWLIFRKAVNIKIVAKSEGSAVPNVCVCIYSYMNMDSN